MNVNLEFPIGKITQIKDCKTLKLCTERISLSQIMMAMAS